MLQRTLGAPALTQSRDLRLDYFAALAMTLYELEPQPLQPSPYLRELLLIPAVKAANIS